MQTADVIARTYSAAIQCAAQSGSKRFGVMKVGFMARAALPLLLSVVAAGAVHAQDALPETPPELRDFRLDPERPAPAPQPQPDVQPPPVVPTVQPTAPDARPRTERPAPSATPAAEQPTITTAPEVSSTAEPSPQVESQPEAETAAPLPTITPSPSTESAADPTSDSGSFPWELAAAIAAALALLCGWLWLRRSRRERTDSIKHEPVKAVIPAPAPVLPKSSAPPIAVATKRPQISLEFIPDKATLGFSSLTLKGQLQLVNSGDVPARDMQLRLAMISANRRQKETISAFSSGAIPIEPKLLDDAMTGERLALDIEMAVQVSDLESYMIGDKKIFVPVMLANLAYSWDGGTDTVTMAWIVGRESAPSQTKMGPLRLDLGPRSFAPLGQRPIYA